MARRDLPRADPVLESTTKSYRCVVSVGGLDKRCICPLFQKKRVQDKCEIKSVLWTCHWCARMAKDTRAMEIVYPYDFCSSVSPCLIDCHAKLPGIEPNDHGFGGMSEPCTMGAGTSHNALIKLTFDKLVAPGLLAFIRSSSLVN